ncbi:hypothetical protein [Microbacterium sp. Bi128]|uniref:hypothetical protein n=1 Tax=Microbacterium sp. Bi128 TaxID=2821115 RepID=UPI001D4F471B|nr:hypothetical protein [Microbacterium sp. Bi128]CAH0326849.1 hypothetical protein SRABI128_05604 [Microbacterium sp. Bi128]
MSCDNADQVPAIGPQIVERVRVYVRVTVQPDEGAVTNGCAQGCHRPVEIQQLFP